VRQVSKTIKRILGLDLFVGLVAWTRPKEEKKINQRVRLDVLCGTELGRGPMGFVGPIGSSRKSCRC
jgi:hypothetical protein